MTVPCSSTCLKSFHPAYPNIRDEFTTWALTETWNNSIATLFSYFWFTQVLNLSPWLLYFYHSSFNYLLKKLCPRSRSFQMFNLTHIARKFFLLSFQFFPIFLWMFKRWIYTPTSQEIFFSILVRFSFWKETSILIFVRVNLFAQHFISFLYSCEYLIFEMKIGMAEFEVWLTSNSRNKGMTLHPIFRWNFLRKFSRYKGFPYLQEKLTFLLGYR